jgi:hypothetical protein
MAYPLNLKEKAVTLRKQGYSIKEIAKLLHVAASTSSSWLSNIKLSPEVKQILAQKMVLGQYKSSVVIREKTRQRKLQINEEAVALLKRIKPNAELDALLCSILYWAEGSKHCSLVSFTNSDPEMISIFLKLFRSAFELDESKFRCLVHIHEYHNDEEEKLYWSNITAIPVSQFNKSYHKPHTGKRKKLDYHGTISIRYYDSRIAVKINSLYNMFAKHRGVA